MKRWKIRMKIAVAFDKHLLWALNKFAVSVISQFEGRLRTVSDNLFMLDNISHPIFKK